MLHSIVSPVTPPTRPQPSSRRPNGSRATPRVRSQFQYRDVDTPSPPTPSASEKVSISHGTAKSPSDTDIEGFKPTSIADEHDSSPPPTKKRRITAGRGDKRGGGTGARSPKKSTSKKEVASGGSRTGAWTSEEDWKLFQHIYPRVTPNWAEVARDIGRDAKSCSNRLAVFNKRLPDAIKGISRYQ